ncbi:hypothetical protein PROFUN_05889 [Planoprotostelium fungivorum]|uniref:Uncharacterized protein n=1 Tax=Planoprotostelium fungivorum TaxID=1890364 RepID=A0A2P6NKR1_9EUKA|nr:hypothetical protein PROFUN_05889 [Planoprotostelium fungivorum]
MRWSDSRALRCIVLVCLIVFTIIITGKKSSSPSDNIIALRSLNNPLERVNAVQTPTLTFNPSFLPLLDGYFLAVLRKTVNHWAGPHSLYLSLAREEVSYDESTKMFLPTMKQKGKAEDCQNTGTGPEDGRLFYTVEGAPLLQMTGPPKGKTKMCHIMWIVDVRTIFNLTNLVLTKAPIVYDKLTPLLRGEVAHGKSDKNWSPFLPSQDYGLMFHVDISSPRYFKVYDDKSVRVHYVPDEEIPCPRRFIPKTLSIHQTTGALSLTLCRRGECVPNRDNTVLFAIVQSLKRNGAYRKYTPYVVTWYNHGNLSYRSISPPLTWPIEELVGKQWVYTHSITWKRYHVKNPTHGYLDDHLVIGGGWSDRTAHYVDVEADSLMKNHKTC